MPGGHRDFARLTGELVGANMARVAGGTAPHPWRELPGWHGEVFGLEVYAWGVSRQIERRVVRDQTQGDRPDVVEIGLDNSGLVCHVLALGHTRSLATLRRLVEERAPAPEA